MSIDRINDLYMQFDVAAAADDLHTAVDTAVEIARLTKGFSIEHPAGFIDGIRNMGALPPELAHDEPTMITLTMLVAQSEAVRLANKARRNAASAPSTLPDFTPE